MAELADLESVRERLVAHRGVEEAEKIISTALNAAGLAPKTRYSAQELYQFADGLVRHGGYVALVGRTVKMKALMAGAQPT